MARHGLTTKKDAVDFALRAVAAPGMAPEEMLAMRGTGWSGDLAALRDGEQAELAAQWGPG